MSEPVNVRIADREYMVACEPHERESLIEAARLLDGRMREIRTANRMAGIDRIAILAALNLAHELLQARGDGGEQNRQIQRTLGELNRRLDSLFDSAATR